MAWKGGESGNNICIAKSSDGKAWSAGKPTNSVETTTHAPVLAVFNGKLYCVWKGNYTNRLIFSSTENPDKEWPHGRWMNGDTTQSQVDLAVYNEKLYITWRGMDDLIYVSGSSDGLHWPEGTLVNSVDKTTHGPSIAVYKGRLLQVGCKNGRSSDVCEYQ